MRFKISNWNWRYARSFEEAREQRQYIINVQRKSNNTILDNQFQDYMPQTKLYHWLRYILLYSLEDMQYATDENSPIQSLSETLT